MSDNGIKLIPIWIYFTEQGFTDEEIENLTLREIENYLNEVSKTKEYVCSWSKLRVKLETLPTIMNYHDDYRGTMKEILSKYPDLDPDEEEWFAWDYVGLADGWGDYVTGGGVTIKEFHADSKVHDKIECDNMTIRRVA